MFEDILFNGRELRLRSGARTSAICWVVINLTP